MDINRKDSAGAHTQEEEDENILPQGKIFILSLIYSWCIIFFG